MNAIVLLQKITVFRLLMTAAFVVCLVWLLFDPHEPSVVGSQVDDGYLPIPCESILRSRGDTTVTGTQERQLNC
jgi:hypothetical protein